VIPQLRLGVRGVPILAAIPEEQSRALDGPPARIQHTLPLSQFRVNAKQAFRRDRHEARIKAGNAAPATPPHHARLQTFLIICG